MLYHATGDKSGLIFLEQPRTASHSIAEALKRADWEEVGGHHCTWAGASPRVRFLASDGRLTRFSLIRNPFDVAVSWYYSLGGGKRRLPFGAEWLSHIAEESGHIQRGQFFWRYAPDSDVLLRYEDLPGCLNELLVEHGLPSVELKHYNRSAGRASRSYRDFYDDESRQWMESVWAEELAQHGYSF